MRCLCVSLWNEPDVLPRLQSGGHRSSPVVGGGIPAWAVRVDVLLQLLVGFAGASDSSLLEFRELQRAPSGRRLLADPLALDVDRCARDVFFLAAGISAGIFSVVLRRCTERPLLSVSDYSALGQLSGQGLCVENDSRLGWRSEHLAAICSPDQTSAGVSALQSVCGRADAYAHLHAVHFSADLCGLGTYPAQSRGGLAGSGSQARADLLESDFSAFP